MPDALKRHHKFQTISQKDFFNLKKKFKHPESSYLFGKTNARMISSGNEMFQNLLSSDFSSRDELHAADTKMQTQ